MTTITQLEQTVARYRTARRDMRRPLRDQGAVFALRLRDERDELVARMDKRWAWLDAHPDHPQFAEREDALLADIATYEAMEDALRDAAAALYGGSAA